MDDVRAVLFDLDGVLVDSSEAWFRLVNAAARHFRKPDVPRDKFDAGWGQGVDADVRDFFPGCKPAEVEAFYERHLLDFDAQIRVDSGAHDVLRALRAADVPRGVVTNTPTFLARDVLAWAGLIGMVDVTVGAGGSLRSKPAPDVVEQACRVIEVPPQLTLLVGDSEFDARAARDAGAQFLGFRTPDGKGIRNLKDVLARIERRG